MTENCIERNKRLNTEKKIADFRVKQKLDYDFKIKYAELRRNVQGAQCADLVSSLRRGLIDLMRCGKETQKSGIFG